MQALRRLATQIFRAHNPRSRIVDPIRGLEYAGAYADNVPSVRVTIWETY